MTGYVIFQEDILDQEQFEHYKTLSPQSIVAYGGEFVVRGGTTQILEGAFDYQRVVVIAFPTLQKASAWYHSDEYAHARALRLQISRGAAVLVPGVD